MAGEPLILPLNENNQAILTAAITRSGKTEVPAINIKTNQTAFFTIMVYDDGALELELSDAGERYILFSRESRESFIRFTNHFLNRQSIRLFSFDHPLAILEWQSQNSSHGYVAASF